MRKVLPEMGVEEQADSLDEEEVAMNCSMQELLLLQIDEE